MHFTNPMIRALRPGPRRIDLWATDPPGFGLRLSEQGRKTFVLRYRVKGRRRRLTLGTYPALTLAKARAKAWTALGTVAEGKDPAQIKHDAIKAETFGQLATVYLRVHAKKKKRSWKTDERIINIELLPTWKHTKASDITKADVLAVIETIADRPAPIMANRTLALIRKIFNVGIRRDILPFNPCAQVDPPGKERQRARVLTDEEIRAVWTALDQEALAHPTIAALFKLRLLTAQRGQEVSTMRWADLDASTKLWTIPGAIAKNGLEHRVPLSSMAWDLLEDLRDQQADDLDSANRIRARKHLPPALPSAYVFPTRRRHIGEDRPLQRHLAHAVDRIRARAGVDFWPHDLRRTAATCMTAGSIQRFVVARILNHADSGVTHIYDRASYDAEKRAALDWWALRLRAILDQTPATVLPFQRGA